MIQGTKLISFSELIPPGNKFDVGINVDLDVTPFLVLETEKGYEIIDGVLRYWAVVENPPDQVAVFVVSGDICWDVQALRQLNKNKIKL